MRKEISFIFFQFKILLFFATGTQTRCFATVNRYISQNYLHIRKCIYFSDGAPRQFKNVKYFANIFHHEFDFSIYSVF